MNKIRQIIQILTALIIGVSSFVLNAQSLEVVSVFWDNMVLQREKSTSLGK